MVNEQTLQGNWNEVKGKLRSRWGQLTNDDLKQFSGDVEQLVGLIQRKTGDARESIRRYLDELAAGGASMAEQAGDGARYFAQQASERIQEGTEYVSESMRQGYEEAEAMVRRRPVESALVCFGAGLFVGLLVGLTRRA
ncbi:MAG: CsbD family protein [Planctomycetaceae bacterium]